MLRSVSDLIHRMRQRSEARRQERFKAFANAIVRDCYDPALQAKRYARWTSLFSH